MSKRLCRASCCLLIALLSLASTAPPQLFEKAKEQFRQASYSEALKTLDEMARVSAEPGNEKYRTGLTPALAFYRGACLAALGRNDEARAEFETYLAFQPNAQLDPNVYPKSVISALEDARVNLQKKERLQQGSIAAAYEAFHDDAQTAPETGDGWPDPAIRILMNAEERRAFEQLTTPASRHEFVANFWASRSAFRNEFQRRVAFADKHFSQDALRGSLTDRGQVFILLGPPTYVGMQQIHAGDDASDPAGITRYSPKDVAVVQKALGSSPAGQAMVDKMTGPSNNAPEVAMKWRQIWHYRKDRLPKNVRYQEVDLEFITRDGYGNNVLQRDAISLNALDAARKALQNPELDR